MGVKNKKGKGKGKAPFVVEAKSATESGTETETESGTETETESGTENETESGTETGSGTESDSKNELRDASSDAEEPVKRGTELATKLTASISIGAAFVLAFMLAILSNRHYKRWDLTRARINTLSPATLETLHGLPEPVKIFVLLGEGDALRGALEQSLDAYRAETPKLDVTYIDPDKNLADFLAVQQKYDLAAGKSQDGRVVSDAAVIVVHDERHQELLPGDLVAYDQANETKAAPRIEQAITGAIRSVFDSEKPRVCVTQGMGEHGLEEAGELGLAHFRERLMKNSYEVAPVFGDPADWEPLRGCNMVVVAGPQQKLPDTEVKAITEFIEGGGGAFIVLSPLPNEGDPPWFDTGAGPILALAGVSLQNAFVFEQETNARVNMGHGEIFYAKVETHPITAGIEHEEKRGLGVLLQGTGSLKDLKNDATPSPLLRSSDKAFGLTNFAAFAAQMTDPVKSDADFPGPLVLATATERPKVHATDPHGPRIVVAASISVLYGRAWTQAPLRGTSRFTESAISWIASHRAFLDIPDRPAAEVFHLTEQGMGNIEIWVLLVIPATAVGVGVLVFLARRRRPKTAAVKAA